MCEFHHWPTTPTTEGPHHRGVRPQGVRPLNGAKRGRGLVLVVPRRPRENQAGGIYHVFARGINRAAIYLDDRDRRRYLERLEQVARRLRWRGLAYCLMDNHVHLLVETPDPNLSEGMRLLHGAYGQWFNIRHHRVGHLFQGRYGSVPMKSDGQVCAAALYIARNPVSAALCKAPDDWPWGSFQATAAGRVPSWMDDLRLLAFFGSDREVARRHFSEMARADPQANLKGVRPRGV